MDTTIDLINIPEPVLREKIQIMEIRIQEADVKNTVMRKMKDVSEKMFQPENLRKLKEYLGSRRRHEEEYQMNEP